MGGPCWQVGIYLFSLKRVHRLFDALCILAFYPLSLVVVYVLENILGLD